MSSDPIARGLAVKAGSAYANVSFFGAAGNGTADDTAAIQAAVNSLPANGGVVFLPAGSYKITSTITLPTATRLIGVGRGGNDAILNYYYPTKIDASSITAAAAIAVSPGVPACSIEDLYMVGPSEAFAAASELGGSIGFYGVNSQSLTVRNVSLLGFTNALVFSGCNGVSIWGARQDLTKTHGLVISNCNFVDVFNSFFQNVGGVSSDNNASNVYILNGSRSCYFYNSLVDEAFTTTAPAASVYVLGASDIGFYNSIIFVSGGGYGVRLGDGTTNPDRVTLGGIRAQPFGPSYTVLNTIKISGGTGHVLNNVTTSLASWSGGAAGSGGDISDSGTGTAWINVNGITKAAGPSLSKSYTVATLPAAASYQGAHAFVTDANATFTAGIGAIVAAGGANIVPVFSDGTNWRIG